MLVQVSFGDVRPLLTHESSNLDCEPGSSGCTGCTVQLFTGITVRGMSLWASFSWIKLKEESSVYMENGKNTLFYRKTCSRFYVRSLNATVTFMSLEKIDQPV